MLETASSSAGSPLPIAVGISKIKKAGSHRISDIATYQSFGIVGMKARMPRRSETDYMNKSIANALRADGTFRYVYATPYDPKDVDLIISVHLQECKMENSIYGTALNHVTYLPIPLVNPFVPLGELAGIIPMERFSVKWTMVFNVSTPSGKLLKQYKHACNDSDMVNLWSQPFANYMWYDSLFISNFEDAISTVTKNFRKDRAEILAAIQ